MITQKSVQSVALIAAIAAWWGGSLLASQAFAQFNRSGRFGTASSSLGSTSMGSSNFRGLSGTGTSQRVSSGTGLSGGLGLSSALSSRLSGQQTRQGAARAGRQAGRFVGADASDVANLLGFITNPNQATQAWRQGLSAIRTTQQRQPTQLNRGTTIAGGRGAARDLGEISAIVEVGFEPPMPTLAEMTSSLQTRFEKAGVSRLDSPIDVVIESDTVVLRGTVGSAHQRLLAENLARLEPGVRSVRNELVVSSATVESE